MNLRRIRLFLVILLAVWFGSCTHENDPGENKNVIVPTIPIQITTTDASGVTINSALSGGNITSDGGSAIIERGVCWSTNANPTISGSHTSDGNGLGPFTSSLSGLLDGIEYYVRAFARNADTVAYGNQINFTTTIGGTGACAGGPATVTDVDGNTYNVVSIGNQCWMKENLKTTRYRNGVGIPTGLNNVQWQTTTTDAYAIFNDSAKYDSIYGKLYNWYAVANPNGLCPVGWHLPSELEWNKLVKALDPGSDTICINCIQSYLVGGAMKQIGLVNWTYPNVGATNTSGFTALPGGARNSNSSYYFASNYGFWWSATPYSTTNGFTRYLKYSASDVYRSNSAKTTGVSVRCVRD